ncbi:MAG: YkgJ family cysteine cluster protein [Halobacteriota archaeon]
MRQSERRNAKSSDGSNSYDTLFARERREELTGTLCRKVLGGLYSRERIAEADVYRIASELVTEISTGPFKRLRVRRNVDGSFRPFCAGCERPWCCIVFETIRLTVDDIWKLSERFAMPPDAFAREHCEKYTDAIKPHFAYRLNRAMPCEFLHEDRCSVYAHRPERCRLFPLQCDRSEQNFVIYPWCNYFFNLLWHEATLRVLEHILQEHRSNEARIRYGGIIDVDFAASNALSTQKHSF